MSIPQITIRTMLYAILLIAADCAALRTLVGGTAPFRLALGLFGTLPMANILVIACYRDPGNRPFLIGFCSAGGVAILIYLFLCSTTNERYLMSKLDWATRTAENLVLVNLIGSQIGPTPIKVIYYHTVRILFLAGLTTFPMLIPAILGGWFARRSDDIEQGAPPYRS